MKKCPNCNEVKEEACFHKDKSRKCGLQVYCKKCKYDMFRADYDKNKEKYNKRTAVYRNTDKGREVNLGIASRYAKTEKGKKLRLKMKRKYPGKYTARNKVFSALQRGEIVRGECEYIGGECRGRIESHHVDYNKPLDIKWLCKKHHVLADKVKKLVDLSINQPIPSS